MTSPKERVSMVHLRPKDDSYMLTDFVMPLDMHVALNYGQATGSPPMVRFVTEHTEVEHSGIQN